MTKNKGKTPRIIIIEEQATTWLKDRKPPIPLKVSAPAVMAGMMAPEQPEQL